MTGIVITELRRGGGVDPSRILTGPLRAVALQWLDPEHSAELAADHVEHALYVTSGTGEATAPRSDAAPEAVPLAEGTALTLPLGTRTILSAGPGGLEYVHVVLAVTEEASDDRHH